jgi:hypothetical protein
MPLSVWDDYLIHQTAKTIDTYATDDINAMDRLWFMVYSPDGDLQLMAGLGVYPNSDVVDGYVVARRGTVQRNVRVSRRATPDRFSMDAGPLAFEVVEPQRRWRFRLTDNDHDLTCELSWEARTDPFLYLGSNDPGVPDTYRHYKQHGWCSGTVTFEGQTVTLDRAPSVRDRSWGVRAPKQASRFDMMLMVEAHFPSSALTLSYRREEGAFLTEAGERLLVTGVRHAIGFDETDPTLVADVALELTDEKGATHELVAHRISPPCYFAGAGYDGRHGADRGPQHIEGERWVVGDGRGPGATDFPYYSVLATMTLDGEPGTGHVEAYFSDDPARPYQPTWTGRE